MARRKLTAKKQAAHEAMDEVRFMLEGMEVEVVPSLLDEGSETAAERRRRLRAEGRRRAARRRDDPPMVMRVISVSLMLVGLGTVAGWVWQFMRWLL